MYRYIDQHFIWMNKKETLSKTKCSLYLSLDDKYSIDSLHILYWIKIVVTIILFSIFVPLHQLLGILWVMKNLWASGLSDIYVFIEFHSIWIEFHNDIVIHILSFFSNFFLVRVTLYNLGWPLTHRNLLAFTSKILGINMYGTLLAHPLFSFVLLTTALSCLLALALGTPSTRVICFGSTTIF